MTVTPLARQMAGALIYDRQDYLAVVGAAEPHPRAGEVVKLSTGEEYEIQKDGSWKKRK